MYLYKIGYYDYDEGSENEFIHEQLFSEEDITRMVVEAIIDTIKIEEKKGKDGYIYPFGFSGFYRDVIKYLIEQKGFTPVKYDVTWFTGGRSIYGYNEYEDEDDRKDMIRGLIIKLLNEAGYDQKFIDKIKEEVKYNEDMETSAETETEGKISGELE